MSLYLKGIQTGAIAKRDVQVGASEPGLGKTMAFGLVILAGVWFFVRKKSNSHHGPDTSDIDDRIRSRGVDPKTYY